MIPSSVSRLIRATSLCTLFVLVASAGSAAASSEAVVLLHGLWRSERSMKPIAEHLADAGYAVFNLGYESNELPPDELVADLAERVASCCSGVQQVHFVTHSFGGILARAYLAAHELENLGRVVMLAPPNQGSELVDRFGKNSLVRASLGPSGSQLGTDANALPRRLPAPKYPVGVIAGTRSRTLILRAMLDEENDGTVTVASTKLEGMQDFITVHYSHTRIMRSQEVAAHTAHFLRTGRFVAAETASD